MSVELLLDNSAWARLDSPSLTEERIEEISAALEGGRIAVCLPFLLEAGYSARSAVDHSTLFRQLLALPALSSDARSVRRALAAQAQLARVGHHRMPPVDLMVASIADRYDVGVLHYDGDYDVLRAKTDLQFESTWIAPRGSL